MLPGQVQNPEQELNTMIPPFGSEGLPDGRGLHARLLHLLAQQVRGGASLQYRSHVGLPFFQWDPDPAFTLNAETDRDPAVFGTDPDPEPRIRTSG